MNDMPTCVRPRCTSVLRDDEWGRLLCFRCEDQVAQQLTAIQGPHGLYAQLGQHLQRGASNGPAVSGSKTAPAPLRVDILNLQCDGGPVLSPLEGWVRVWEEAGHAELNEAGTLQQRVDHACQTLRYNLRWAVEQHPAVDEFAAEVALIHRTLTGITGAEKPARKLHVACTCGHAVPFTLNTRGETCHSCGTEYARHDIFNLQLTERRAAA